MRCLRNLGRVFTALVLVAALTGCAVVSFLAQPEVRVHEAQHEAQLVSERL